VFASVRSIINLVMKEHGIEGKNDRNDKKYEN